MDTFEKTPRKRLKKRVRLLIWLIADVVFAGVILALLLYKPPGYKPVDTNAQTAEGPRQVSSYLTYLYSQLHNNAQQKETFEIEVLEDGINQAIASANWPQRSDGIVFAKPKAALDKKGITVTGTVNVQGVDLVVTIHGLLQILEDGKLNVHVQTVKIGAMNVTLAAKYLAKNMYKERFGMMYVDSADPRVLIAASLMEDTPFDPVFEVNDRRVRLTGATMDQDLVRLKFEPLP